MIVFLAAFVANRGRDTDGRGLVATIGLGLIPVGLVFLQPDFGTALVYMAGLTAVLFFAGTRWLHLGILATLTVLAALMVLWWLPAAGMPVLKAYQQQRLTNFLHPNHDPQGATYNQTQAQIAVGAGGTSGRGVCPTSSSPNCATQTTLNFLPEHHTDFAFASVSEQRGFLGAIFLLLLYLLVVWRGLKTVATAADSFSAIVAGAIVVAFLFQVFVNIGMTIGIAPITGIPLPFVSYGGSAAVSNLLALGLLQGIHARGRRRR
jgi:rod shape determining protein RodA